MNGEPRVFFFAPASRLCAPSSVFLARLWWGESSGCALVPFSRDFFCSTMNALKKQQQGAGASGRETTLLLVGDSIMLHQ